ncbi:MAG: hypothetical protein R3C18_04680 [Planctomycetaceae bacterium]
MSLTPEDLAAELPEPQPGEPENLRQDILDELADHLQCALSDEQRRMACEGRFETEEAEQIARGRVIERFGNPVQIACQLWWDAMWEKVMSQRVQTISVVVGVLVVVGMFFLMWGELRNSRAQLNAQLDESRSMQKQLMDELSRVRQQPQAVVAPQPAEWNNLSVVCVSADDEETPLEGVEVSLSTFSKNTAGIPPSEEVTDATGRIDFGQVLYGQYVLNSYTPNGFTKTMTVSVRPGQDKTVRVVCPKGNGEMPVKLEAPAGQVQTLAPETRQHIHRALSLNSDIPIEKQVWTIYYMLSGENGFGFQYEGWKPSGQIIRYVAANQAGDVVPLPSFGEQNFKAAKKHATLRGGPGRAAFAHVAIPELQQALSSGQFDATDSWPVGSYYQMASYVAVPVPDSNSGEYWLLNNWEYKESNNGYGGDYFGPGEAGYPGGGNPYGPGNTATSDIQPTAPIGKLSEQLLRHTLGIGAGDQATSGAEGYGGMSGGEGYGMAPYSGGGLGGGYSPGASNGLYLVGLESPVEFTLPEMPHFQLDLMRAALISRLPAEMTFATVAAQCETEIINREQAGYDLVWQGVTVNDSGSVTPEEHVLVANVDVISSFNNSNQIVVAVTPQEKILLDEFCRAAEVFIRPTGMQARRNPAKEIDTDLLRRLMQTRPATLPGPHRTTPVATTTRTEQLTVSHDPNWTPAKWTAVDVFLRLDDGTTIPCVRKVYINAVPPDDEIRSNYEDGVTGTYTLHIPISHRDLEKYPGRLAFRAKLWIAPTTLESSKVQAWTNDLEQRVQVLLKQSADEAAAPEESTSPEE